METYVKTLKPATVDDPKPCHRLEPGQALALMLRLEWQSGALFALPYAHLSSVAYDAKNMLELGFATHRVSITGRNLTPLIDLLAHHRVEALREHGTRADHFPPFVTVIHTLTLEPLSD
jgi:hypothetical protein